MNDTLRMLVMQTVTVGVALIVAFGVSLTQEQAAGIVAFAAAVTNLAAYAFKSGQGQ